MNERLSAGLPRKGRTSRWVAIMVSLALPLLAVSAAGAWAGEVAVVKRGAGPAFPGFSAEVEVRVAGVVRHGRLIVGPDGRVFLEHLDVAATQWCLRLLPPKLAAGTGWDDRPLRCRCQRQVRHTWARVGLFELLAGVEVLGPGATQSLQLTRHTLLKESLNHLVAESEPERESFRIRSQGE